jgi:hypothetical protein
MKVANVPSEHKMNAPNPIWINTAPTDHKPPLVQQHRKYESRLIIEVLHKHEPIHNKENLKHIQSSP